MEHATVSVVTLQGHEDVLPFGTRCQVFLEQVSQLASEYDLKVVATVPSTFIVDGHVQTAELQQAFRDPTKYRLFTLHT